MSKEQHLPKKQNSLTARSDLDFALKAAKLGVWELDPSTQIVHWNELCQEFFDLKGDHFPLSEIVSRIHPDDRNWVAEARKRAMTPGFSDDYNVTYRTVSADDNEVKWLKFNGKAEYDVNGSLTRFAGIAQDVTKEKADREQAKRSEAHFRGLIEEAPFAIAVYRTRNMVIDIANDAIIKIWGKTSAVIGQELATALPELEGQPFIQLLENVYDTGISYQSDQQMVDLVVDGILQSFWFKFTYHPLKDINGNVYAILNMAVDITQRVLHQQELEESQRKILQSFEQSPVAIAIISKENHVFTMANPFYGELVGRKPEQLVGKSLLDVMPELRGQGFDKLITNVIETGIPYIALEVPVDLKRNDLLETIYVDLTYRPQYESDGSISGILVIATHVTAQVKARQEVEAKVAQLSSIIANAPAAMGLFIGRDLMVQLPNQAFIDIVGKGPDIVGKPLREVMPELENQDFLQILDDVYTTGKMFQSFGAQVNIVQNGVMTYNFYNITYSPLFNDAGEVYGILDIAIDVTDQVKAKQEIFEAEQHLSGAIELAELATWTYDIKANKFKYSNRFMEWLGLTEDSLTADEAYNPLPPVHRHSVQEAIEDAIRPGSSGIYENEHPIVNRVTGQRRIIHALAKVFYNSEGEAIRLSGSAQDVTEQRKTELSLEQLVQERTEELEATNEELAAANEELAAVNEEFAATNEDLADANTLLTNSNQNLEQFAYIASHDLQEPLRKIQQYGDLLRARYESPTPQALMYLDRMQAAAGRMSTLISDLLTYARISNNPRVFEPISLNDVLTSTLTDLELRIQETEAKIDLGELPIIQGDRMQLGQLFQNLISNALKFHTPDTRPHISLNFQTVTIAEIPKTVNPAKWSATYYAIEVADNGIGFDEKYLGRIFQAFQRLHGKNEFAGTGIGLAICEKVVSNHGGAITARSSPGQGAVFTVYFPKP